MLAKVRKGEKPKISLTRRITRKHQLDSFNPDTWNAFGYNVLVEPTLEDLVDGDYVERPEFMPNSKGKYTIHTLVSRETNKWVDVERSPSHCFDTKRRNINKRINYKNVLFCGHFKFCRECFHFFKFVPRQWDRGIVVHFNVTTDEKEHEKNPYYHPHCIECVENYDISELVRLERAKIGDTKIIATVMNYPRFIENYHFECFQKRTNMSQTDVNTIWTLLIHMRNTHYVWFRLDRKTNKWTPGVAQI